MSYTHIHLPELHILKEWLEKRPESIKYYSRYEAFVGPSESVDYIVEKIEKFIKK